MPKVTSYELSKRLHDAGIVVESEQWYAPEMGEENAHIVLRDKPSRVDSQPNGWWAKHSVPAPDCSEMLEVFRKEGIIVHIRTCGFADKQLITVSGSDKYGEKATAKSNDSNLVESLGELALSLREAGVI